MYLPPPFFKKIAKNLYISVLSDEDSENRIRKFISGRFSCKLLYPKMSYFLVPVFPDTFWLWRNVGDLRKTKNRKRMRKMKIQDISFPTKKTDQKNLTGKIPYKNYYFIGSQMANKKKGCERVKLKICRDDTFIF